MGNGNISGKNMTRVNCMDVYCVWEVTWPKIIWTCTVCGR